MRRLLSKVLILKGRLQSFNIFLRFVSDKGFNYAIDETHNMFVFLIIFKINLTKKKAFLRLFFDVFNIHPHSKDSSVG
jgi:hypothetical protein